MTARSTVDTRKLDPTAIIVFHQADVGEYLRDEVCITQVTIEAHSVDNDFPIRKHSSNTNFYYFFLGVYSGLFLGRYTLLHLAVVTIHDIPHTFSLTLPNICLHRTLASYTRSLNWSHNARSILINL